MKIKHDSKNLNVLTKNIILRVIWIRFCQDTRHFLNYLEWHTVNARFRSIKWYTIQIEWLDLTFAFWEISISDHFLHICHFPSSEPTSRQPIPYYSLSLEKALRVMMPYDNKRAQQLLWIVFRSSWKSWFSASSESGFVKASDTFWIIWSVAL